MTSPARAAANRRNAARSTGPRTPGGKARSAANALKHGLTAVRATLRCEDREAWERLRADLIARRQPESEAEARLVDDLAFHYLRLGRLPLAEAGAWNACWQEDVWPRQPFFGEVVEGLAHESIGFGVAMKNGVMGELCRLTLYEQRIRRAIDKTRAELARLQAERRRAEALAQDEAADGAARLEAETLLAGLEQVERARDPDPRPLRETQLAEPPPDLSWMQEEENDPDDSWLCKDTAPAPPPFERGPAPAPAMPASQAELEAWVVRERARLDEAERAFTGARAAAETSAPPAA